MSFQTTKLTFAIASLVLALSVGQNHAIAADSEVSSEADTGSVAAVNPPVTIGKYTSSSFAPSRNEEFGIPLKLEDAENIAVIVVEIRSSDDDLIRILKPDLATAKENVLTALWDGKDSEGKVVPDEAYVPIVLVTDKAGEIHTVDSRQDSGGEEVYDFEKTIRPGVIEYNLPVNTRMLVRSGIKNGPMLRTLLDWVPRSAGFHAERWNGRDADGVLAVEANPRVGHLIIGYSLPKHAILSYGNDAETYRQYRERNKLPLKQTSYENRLLERNGKLMRQEYYNPVLQQKSPRIDVSLLTFPAKETTTTVSGFDELLAEVKVHPQDEFYLDQERYEVSFFVDNEFLAEDEQGYMPFTWRWSPARYGIKPGKHVLTVNISGYKGQVSVKNIAFELLEKSNAEVADSPAK